MVLAVYLAVADVHGCDCQRRRTAFIHLMLFWLLLRYTNSL